MKKFVCLIVSLLVPLFAFAQDAKKETSTAPKKTTLNIYRVWVKDGHTDAFKAAVTAHAQKFHSGNWKWRVSEVLSGPDGSSFQIAEGPNSWTDLEGRGDLGAEHQKDYDTNIAPHVEKTSPDSFITYQESVSTTGAANWSNKSLITSIYYKPGKSGAVLALLKNYKSVWEKIGYNVVVWSASNSGEPRYIIVRRLKNGWKDLDEGGPTFRESFDAVHGAGAFDRGQEELSRSVDRSVGEMIEFKPELSSK